MLGPQSGDTALHLAHKTGNDGIITLLIKANADVHIKNHAVRAAAQRSSVQTLTLFEQQDKEASQVVLNRRARGGRTPNPVRPRHSL
jgi:ankyrin repeat protein